MFFFRNNREPTTGGDIFAGFILFLIIASIIAILAVYVGLFILSIFLGIGVGIGLIYSIIVYVRAFMSSIPTIKTKTGKGPISTFLLKYFVLLKETSILAFKDNISIAQSALIKAHSYRFISFKKWMWLIVAPSVLIIGSALIILLALLQFQLLALLSLFIVIIVGLIILCCAIINMITAIANNLSILKKTCSVHRLQCFEFSNSTTYNSFVISCKTYWSGFIAIIKDIYRDNISAIKVNYADAISYGLLHIKRYYYLGVVVATYLLTLMLIFGTILVRMIVFIPLLLANIFWATIMAIINH